MIRVMRYTSAGEQVSRENLMSRLPWSRQLLGCSERRSIFREGS